MTTATIIPEVTPATDGITPVAVSTAPVAAPTLPLVAESAASCSHDEAAHEHAPHHDHGAGCCSTTAPAVVETGPACAGSTETAPTETACSDEGSSDDGSTVDEADLIEALREVIDPELMINIVDLGLVYSINHTDRKAQVEMTLTSPACPAGPQIIMQSKMALEKLEGVDVAEIKLVMSPPWTPARMTDEARDQLGIF